MTNLILAIIGISLGVTGITNSYIQWHKANEQKRKKIKKGVIASIVFGTLAITFGVIAILI